MQSVKTILQPKTIVRARLLLGALLLFAAVLTWGIGLSLSPHGKAVVAGTEHIRSTVVTFRRNSAIGTLFLSAIAAWLLFPRLRSRQPVRDWTLIVLLALLAGSSAYTLLFLRGSPTNAAEFDENLAISNVSDLNAAESSSEAQASNMLGAPASQLSKRQVDERIPSFHGEAQERTAREKLSQPDESAVSDDQASTLNDAASSSAEDPTNDPAGNHE